MLVLAPTESERPADQTTLAIDINWVSSVLKGENLAQLLESDVSPKLSGHIFKPDIALTESMPIFSPPPVDEGIFIPGFKKQKNSFTLPPETE